MKILDCHSYTVLTIFGLGLNPDELNPSDGDASYLPNADTKKEEQRAF